MEQESLSRLDSLILTSLVHGPEHAVVLREAIERAEGLFLEPDTLYRALARLEQRGWIVGEEGEEPLRPYRLTVLGMLALESAEAGRQREQLRQGWRSGWLRGKETLMRLVIWMLRLYPPAWRERYEAEMVALLEQHDITLWTVGDLLIGALDARLDPHYRQVRPQIAMRRLQTSCRLLATTFFASWLVTLFWFSLSDVRASNSPADPPTLLIMSTLSLFSFPFILPALVGRIGWQASKNAWKLLRFLPIAAFLVLLIQLTPSANTAFLAAFAAVLILAAESGGALLVPLYAKSRAVLLLGLPVAVVMVLSCIEAWFYMLADWDLFPRMHQVNPFWQPQLAIEFALAVLTTLITLFALVRGSFALRAMGAASPKQEPLHAAIPLPGSDQQDQPPQPSGENNNATSSTARGYETNPCVWIIVAPLLAVLSLYAFYLVFNLGSITVASMFIYVLVSGIAAVIIAYAFKLFRVKMPVLQTQQNLRIRDI